jgi:hypothetical protein
MFRQGAEGELIHAAIFFFVPSQVLSFEVVAATK